SEIGYWKGESDRPERRPMSAAPTCKRRKPPQRTLPLQCLLSRSSQGRRGWAALLCPPTTCTAARLDLGNKRLKHCHRAVEPSIPSLAFEPVFVDRILEVSTDDRILRPALLSREAYNHHGNIPDNRLGRVQQVLLFCGKFRHRTRPTDAGQGYRSIVG